MTRKGRISLLDASLLEPGGGLPKHTNAAEHEQYLLKGKVRVGIGKKVFEVKIGDTVLIPERVRNWYEAEEKKIRVSLYCAKQGGWD